MSSARLRILLLGDYSPDPTLGSPKVFYKLQSEFVEMGHACDIALGDAIGGPASRQVRQLLAPIYAAHVIRRRLASGNYDIVDAASAEGLWFGMMRKAGGYARTAYICRSNGLEHVNYARMLADAEAGLTRKPLSRRLWYPLSRLSQVSAAARVADRLLVLNRMDRDFAIDRGWQPRERVDVVGHGVADAFLRDDPPKDAPRGRGLLFCGSWDHVKGIDYIVKAIEMLHAEGCSWPLTVLGPGVPADMVLASFAPAVRPRVTVIARAPEQTVLQMYREHDALLFTSTYEGFGLVLLEAMSQRLPAIATPVGCAPDLIEDGRTGLSIPPRDAAALANAIKRLMMDQALRRSLGAGARAATSGMSWRATAERTIAVYERALERLTRSRPS